eukprot:206115-Rhodomonas_salina.1
MEDTQGQDRNRGVSTRRSAAKRTTEERIRQTQCELHVCGYRSSHNFCQFRALVRIAVAKQRWIISFDSDLVQ